MSDINPMLLLVLCLLQLGLVIVWGLSIYTAVRICRRKAVRAWPWVLLAVALGFVTFGPVLLCTGYLARVSRRSVAAWVLLEVLVAIGVGVLAWLLMPMLKVLPLLAQLGALLLGLLAALAPVAGLGLLGPKRCPQAAAAPGEPLIKAVKLQKTYHLGKQDLHVLRGVSLTVARGEFVAVLGASGSGKSTLLHLLGLLDAADSGSIVIDGTDTRQLVPAERDRIRCQDIGFVFQFYHLLPELNVLENTLLPAMTGTGIVSWPGKRQEIRRRAIEVLGRLGLGERLDHRPRELSGGEQQRVAIARALLNSPKILLADEPTGNLDSATGAKIIELLNQINAQTRQTIVMVTHDQALAQKAHRLLHLKDGRLE